MSLIALYGEYLSPSVQMVFALAQTYDVRKFSEIIVRLFGSRRNASVEASLVPASGRASLIVPGTLKFLSRKGEPIAQEASVFLRKARPPPHIVEAVVSMATVIGLAGYRLQTIDVFTAVRQDHLGDLASGRRDVWVPRTKFGAHQHAAEQDAISEECAHPQAGRSMQQACFRGRKGCRYAQQRGQHNCSVD